MEKKRVAAEKRALKKHEAATPSVKNFFFPAVEPLTGAAEKPATNSKKKKKKTTTTPAAVSADDAVVRTGGATSSDAMKPTSKKARVGVPSPPPPTTSSTSVAIKNQERTKSAAPPSAPPSLPVHLLSSSVVFAMDDGELCLAGDLHALFQQPLRAPSSEKGADAAQGVVDLTVSGDEEDSQSQTEWSQPYQDARGAGDGNGTQVGEVIEIDDDD